jgi:hypothetical protein
MKTPISLPENVVETDGLTKRFGERPQRAREALETIEATGRSALGGLRRLLGAARDGDPDYEPQPGAGPASILDRQVRASGLDVVLEIEGI